MGAVSGEGAVPESAGGGGAGTSWLLRSSRGHDSQTECRALDCKGLCPRRVCIHTDLPSLCRMLGQPDTNQGSARQELMI